MKKFYGSEFNNDDYENQSLLYQTYQNENYSNIKKTNDVDNDDFEKEERSNISKGLRIKLTITLLALFATIIVITWKVNDNDSFSLQNEKSIIQSTNNNKLCPIDDYSIITNDLSDMIVLEVSNEYGIFNAPYPWLTNNTYLIEPYKSTMVSIKDFDLCTGDYQYLWEIYDLSTSNPIFNGYTSVPYITINVEEVGMLRIIIKFGIQDLPRNVLKSSTILPIYMGTLVSK